MSGVVCVTGRTELANNWLGLMIKPSPIALVVCDNVYTEPGGKAALVGLFNRITFSRFPAKHPRLCVYASATDFRPNTVIKLDVVHSETDHVVAAVIGSPPDPNPTTICDFTFSLRGLVFPEPGRYYIRLWGNEHLLLQRPFEVVLVTGNTKEDER